MHCRAPSRSRPCYIRSRYLLETKFDASMRPPSTRRESCTLKRMNRRQLLQASLACLAAAGAQAAARPGRIATVTGPVSATDLGATLIHEHILVDFIGADLIKPGRYDLEEVVRVARPHLEQVKKLGCRTFVDCTPAWLGRDPLLLRRLATETGLRIITNTGYYGAGPNAKFVPAEARELAPEKLAARWIAEHEQGIEGSGIRPGFIKTAVANTPLSPLDTRLVRAAALTHLATGLTIASHTGSGRAAIEQLDLLKGEGVPATAFIWVHAQNDAEGALRFQAAERGAWVEIDGMREGNWERRVAQVEEMAARGLLGRVLVSADASWYHAGEPGGGNFLPFDLVFTRFLPEIRKRLGQKAVSQLMEENPARALACH